jgi:hypothetical protein
VEEKSLEHMQGVSIIDESAQLFRRVAEKSLDAGYVMTKCVLLLDATDFSDCCVCHAGQTRL